MMTALKVGRGGRAAGFEPRRGIQWENPLVNINMGMERSIISNGNIHDVYDYMAIFDSYVQLPEGISIISIDFP